jgi:hypothetical protein
MTSAQILTGFLRAQDAESLSFDPADLAGSDWEEVISLAKGHRLTPQFFVRLNKLGKLSDLPAESAQMLRNMYLNSVARGLQLSDELATILGHFNKRDIPVIVLKGPHLVEMVYKDWALRPMSDLDLMVKRHDIGRAVKALKEIGYAASLDLCSEAEIIDHAHFPHLRKLNKFIVEPHFTLEAPASPFNIDIEGLWQRARKTTISGVETLVLSNEDLLLHLCIHAAYHHRFSFNLLPLQDIAEAINCVGKRIDWEILIQRAAEWNASRCLSLTLSLARELFDIEIPTALLERGLSEGQDQGIVEAAKERLFGTSVDLLHLTDNISLLCERRGFWSKAEIVVKRLFPPPVVLSTMYPVNPASKSVYLYYPVRLLDLIRRHAKTILSLRRREASTAEQIRKERQGHMLIDWLTAKD